VSPTTLTLDHLARRAQLVADVARHAAELDAGLAALQAARDTGDRPAREPARAATHAAALALRDALDALNPPAAAAD
jgi:hypothetical protein